MQSVEAMVRELRYARGFAFMQDVSYVQFLDRVSAGERKLRGEGLWDVPHPWLNLFVPRSRILDFAAGVFHGILLRRDDGGAGKGGSGGGPVLVYPMNRDKWDGATSAVLPDGDEDGVFYTVGILRSAVADGDLRRMEEQNAEVARFCEAAGIPCTQYLPYYATQAEWAARHFGTRRWDTFLRRKRKYDPMAILSRGQRIFSYPLA
jgi:cytokinin dehydrogenase